MRIRGPLPYFKFSVHVIKLECICVWTKMLSWTFWNLCLLFVITNVKLFFFFTFVRKYLPMFYSEMVLLLMLMKRTFWTTCKKILKVHYLLLNLFYNICVFNFFLLKNEVLFHHFIVIRVKLLYILLFWHVTHSFAFTYSSMLTLICCIQGYFHPVVFLLSFSCKRFFFFVLNR